MLYKWLQHLVFRRSKEIGFDLGVPEWEEEEAHFQLTEQKVELYKSLWNVQVRIDPFGWRDVGKW